MFGVTRVFIVIFSITLVGCVGIGSSGGVDSYSIYSDPSVIAASSKRDIAANRYEQAKLKREVAKLREEIERAQAELIAAEEELKSAETALSLAIQQAAAMHSYTTTSTGPSYTGPRGGVYHYSSSGKKVYERRR